jgi:hypothetical protein
MPVTVLVSVPLKGLVTVLVATVLFVPMMKLVVLVVAVLLLVAVATPVLVHDE